MRVIIFGIQKDAQQYFINANKKYNFTITFSKESLTPNNLYLCKDKDAIIGGLADLNEENILKISNEFKINIVVARSAGYNSIDINMLKKHNIKCAYGSGYSPTAVAEFAVALSMNISTHILISSHQIKSGDYMGRGKYPRTEIKSSKVGIVGVGTIGLAAAKLFSALGAEVIGYDKYKSEDAKKVVKFLEWNQFLSEADIVVVAAAYVPGENDNMFNKDAFNKMKQGSIFINVARGEMHNDHDLYNALASNKLLGAASDVMKNEDKFLYHKNGTPSEDQMKLINLYPKFISTPHIAYFTTDALMDMAVIALDNIDKLSKGLKFKRRLC